MRGSLKAQKSYGHTCQLLSRPDLRWVPTSTMPVVRVPGRDQVKRDFAKLWERGCILGYDMLGHGTYSEVYKGQRNVGGTNQVVAIKISYRGDPQDGLSGPEMREISILKMFNINPRSPNIVQLMDSQVEEVGTVLVLEYCTEDLHNYMERRRRQSQPLCNDPTRAQGFMLDLLRGVEFCHQKNVLHRDLKPQNLLIDGQGVLKLADFGMARQIGYGTSIMQDLRKEVVTLRYRAPESELLPPAPAYGKNVAQTDGQGMPSTRRDSETDRPPYGLPIDVWSCGCIFAEMLLDYELFHGANSALDMRRHCDYVERFGVAIFVASRYPHTGRPRPNVENLWGQPVYDFLCSMLECNPDKRIDAAKAVVKVGAYRQDASFIATSSFPDPYLDRSRAAPRPNIVQPPWQMHPQQHRYPSASSSTSQEEPAQETRRAPKKAPKRGEWDTYTT